MNAFAIKTADLKAAVKRLKPAYQRWNNSDHVAYAGIGGARRG